MAAASHLNVRRPERKTTAFGLAQPPPLAMHVARPKSAKGRTRPSPNYAHAVEASATSSCPVPSSPQPLRAPGDDAATGRRASSTQQLHPPGQAALDMPDLLQQVPARTSSSLNKYRVLPSISRSELKKSAAERTTGPPAEEEAKSAHYLPAREKAATPRRAQHHGGAGEFAHAPPSPETKPPSGTSPDRDGPQLLLAIRSPSGQRFEAHFRPTDSLGAVLAAAEQRHSATYRRCSIETAEVPRRTFSDLSRSLRECGILHKSVLCILQDEAEP